MNAAPAPPRKGKVPGPLSFRANTPRRQRGSGIIVVPDGCCDAAGAYSKEFP